MLTQNTFEIVFGPKGNIKCLKVLVSVPTVLAEFAVTIFSNNYLSILNLFASDP